MYYKCKNALFLRVNFYFLSLRSCSRYVETNGGGSVPLRCGRLEGCSSSTGETPLPAGQRNTAAHESSRDVSQPKERPYQREGLRAIRL